MAAQSWDGLLMDLTIIITSRSRSELLLRVIDQLERVNFDGRLLIGDASDVSEANRVRARLKGSKLINNFIHKENLSVSSFHKILSQFIETEYSLCIADGGVVFSQSLADCVAFLDANRDYVAVSGDVLLFDKLGTKRVKWLGGAPPMPVCEEQDPIRRFELMVQDYRVPMYCVMRSNAWKSIWEDQASITLDSLSNELLPAFHLFLFGRFGHINRPFLFREMHSKRTTLTSAASMHDEKRKLDLLNELEKVMSSCVVRRDIDDPNKVILSTFKKELITRFALKHSSGWKRRLAAASKKFLFKHVIWSRVIVAYRLNKYRHEMGWNSDDFNNVRGLFRWLNAQN